MLDVFLKMFLRLAIGFMFLIIYINILGRMQLSPKSGIDQIGNYILGGILGGIIYNLDLEFYKFFLALIIWTFLMVVITYITEKSLNAKRVIKGHPILLMENGKFQTKEFSKNNINIDDILSSLHQKNIYTVKDLKTIWLEPNGQLTVIKNDEENIGYVLIEDGHINNIDLERIKKDKDWLISQINKKGYKDIKNIFYAEYLNGDLIIYNYNN